MNNNHIPTILVVERHPLLRDIIRDNLEAFPCIFASSLEETIIKFKEHCPEIIFLDTAILPLHNFDIVVELLSHDPEAFIVLIASSHDAGDILQAQVAGVQGYIAKPFKLPQLHDYIEKYVSFRSQLLSSSSDDRVYNYVDKLNKEHQLSNATPKLSIDPSHATISPCEPHNRFTEKDLLTYWHILFADADLPTHENPCENLSRLGCHVDIATNTQEVWDKIRHNDYQLIFMDTTLPDKGGYILTKELLTYAAHHNQITFIIGMIENNEEIQKKTWSAVGMDEYLVKPYTFPKLRSIIYKYAKRYMEDYPDYLARLTKGS